MTDVFISYKKERRAHAKRLAAVLEAYGFDVWWDYGLLVDAGDYDAQIEAKLVAAKAVVVLWCSGARVSSFVKDEVRRARDAKKLLPVLIEQGVEVPLGFGMAEMAFLLGWAGDPEAQGIIRIVEGVERLAQRHRQRRPNMIEALKESKHLPAVTSMTVSEATDSNAPPRFRSPAPAVSYDNLTDLRATWAAIDKTNATTVSRFRDRVSQISPGSGLEFEVEHLLEMLAAATAEREQIAEAQRELERGPKATIVHEGKTYSTLSKKALEWPSDEMFLRGGLTSEDRKPGWGSYYPANGQRGRVVAEARHVAGHPIYIMLIDGNYVPIGKDGVRVDP